MGLIVDTWHYMTDPDHWSGPRGLWTLLGGHMKLSVAATLAAAAIAIPLGIFFGRRRRGGAAASAVVNIGRALPTFAILVLAFSLFSERGKGLTIWPSFVALVALGIPPIFTNTYTAIRDLDPAMIEAATAMGMTRMTLLRRVQIPAGAPLMITGLRISTVQIVATATLGAWVGYACLGTPIFEGFAQQNNTKVLTGAILVSILTIAVEVGFSLLERYLTPWARVGARRAGGRRSLRSAQ